MGYLKENPPGCEEVRVRHCGGREGKSRVGMMEEHQVGVEHGGNVGLAVGRQCVWEPRALSPPVEAHRAGSLLLLGQWRGGHRRTGPPA